jgi:uncharacterized repeat protein (TIGR03803 family)
MTLRKLAFLGALAGAQPLWGQTFTSLVALDGTNGGQPGPLVQGLNGALYGVTEHGGVDSNFGTVFEMTLGGDLKTLVTFPVAGSDASFPVSLMIYPNGTFYGTAATNVPNGNVIFKMTATGTLTPLATFHKRPVGSQPG